MLQNKLKPIFLIYFMIRATFLGTADSIPSLARNHSSILITKDAENILIDCGEGTQRQFRKAKLNPCKVTKILISHWHGDHVLGLPGLLSTLALSGYNKKLEIYGPKGIGENLDKMFDAFSFKREYEIAVKEVSSGKFFENDEFYLEAEEMNHSVPCVAYNFVEKGHLRIKPEIIKEYGSGRHLGELKYGKDIEIDGVEVKSKDSVYKEDDKKISIVMDTKINDKIVSFVQGADFFISEGTYSGDLKKEAEEHMHMTVKQVGEVAEKAKVGKLFIIHVSSRYLKNMKELLAEVESIFENVYFPRDLEFFEL